MAADKYIIRVTAGPDYDVDKHVEVPVNAPEPVRVSSALIDAELNVRIRDYAGLPCASPPTSPYFAQEPHASAGDRYSMAIRFTPKRPDCTGVPRAEPEVRGGDADGDDDEDEDEDGAADGISGMDLQFGNDFDHPIRDKLPPGFSYAMNIVKWWIDPGLDGDAYADTPYLYGPALSSFNTVHVGPGTVDPEKGGLWFEEGGDDAGRAAREDLGAPATSKERMKWALRKENKERWVFEHGRTYCVDFFNPYLDFSDFSLRLPGFTLPIMKYWDGQPLRTGSTSDGENNQKPIKRSHTLRYVLRNRATEDTYLVILFTLYRREDVEEDGSLKPAALEASRQRQRAAGGSHAEEGKEEEGGEVGLAKGASAGKGDEEQDYDEARRRLGDLDIAKHDTKDGDDDDDDVD